MQRLVSRCLSTGTVSSSTNTYAGAIIGRIRKNIITASNYYLAGSCVNSIQVAAATAEQLKSGETAKALQADRTDAAYWAQVLGDDAPRVYSSADIDTPNYVYYSTASRKWLCAHLQLTDGTALPIGIDFITSDITNTRTLPTNGCYTLCLPYSIDIPMGATAYEMENVDLNSDKIHFTKLTESRLNAYTPYLILTTSDVSLNKSDLTNITAMPAADVSTSTDGSSAFYGTVRGKTNPEAAEAGAYILQSDGMWHPLTTGNDGAYIPPYRAYIILSDSAGGKPFTLILDDDATDITSETFINPEITKRCYDLNGRYLDTDSDALPKGVYIIDGRKVINSSHK